MGVGKKRIVRLAQLLQEKTYVLLASIICYARA